MYAHTQNGVHTVLLKQRGNWPRITDQIRYGKSLAFALRLPNRIGNLVSTYKSGLLNS